MNSWDIIKIPELEEVVRRQANEEVAKAIAAYKAQPWYATAYARVRFAAFWVTYWLRLRLAMFLVLRLGHDEHKTWNRLGL